jgi:hypothetical protein
MIKSIVGLTLAATLTGISLNSTSQISAIFDDLQFLQNLGISDIVYDCAKDVLKGQNVEELTATVKGMENLADREPTPTESALAECVKQDPFGFGRDATPDEKIALAIIQDAQK